MAQADSLQTFARRHVRLGWAAIAVFMTMGLILEALHAFKTGWYLEEQYETRRLLFTLAHAHGSLLGLLNIAFGLTVGRGLEGRAVATASRLFAIGTVLLPGGFFLGGFFLYGSDPGLGALLAPVGAVAVLVAAALAALPGAPNQDDQTGGNKNIPQKMKRRR